VFEPSVSSGGRRRSAGGGPVVVCTEPGDPGPVDSPEWWASLVEWGSPVRVEEWSDVEVEAFLAGDPDGVGEPWAGVEVPVEWCARASAADLYRGPGPELVAAVEEALREGVTGELSDDDLLGVVAACHRGVGWLTTVRGEATRALMERWTGELHRDPNRGPAGGVRARRLGPVRRNALRRWRQGRSMPGRPLPDQEPFQQPEEGSVPDDRDHRFVVGRIRTGTGVHGGRGLVGVWGVPQRGGEVGDGRRRVDQPGPVPGDGGRAWAGHLDPGKVAEIVRATEPLSDEDAAVVEGMVVYRAMLGDPAPPGREGDLVDVELRTIPQLKAALYAAILQVDPDRVRDRAEKATHCRGCCSAAWTRCWAT
jgi:hypothetical protein